VLRNVLIEVYVSLQANIDRLVEFFICGNKYRFTSTEKLFVKLLTFLIVTSYIGEKYRSINS